MTFFHSFYNIFYTEYTELNVPNLNPYKLKDPWVLSTAGTKSTINFEAHLKNIQIYGLNKLEIDQIKFVNRIQVQFP